MLGRLLLLLLIGGAVYLAREPILIALARFLIDDQPPQAADAIIVLGGSLPDRMIGAVDLYKADRAPRIILGRETSNPGAEELERRGGHLPDHADLNVSVAQQLGVPRQAVTIVEGKVSSTIGEAEMLIPYLRSIKAKSVLLVTSKIHTRRAAMVYRTFAPDLHIIPYATPFDPFEVDGWWHSRGNIRRVFFEYQKMAVFLLRDRWRGVQGEK